MLLFGKWLYEQEAVVDFKSGQAYLPKISDEIVQLERTPTFHLLLPVTAFHGNDSVRQATQATDGESRLLRACAQLASDAVLKTVSPEQE